MRTLAALAALLLVAACQAPPSEMTEAEKAAIKAEVEAYLDKYEEIWETLALDRTASLKVQTPEYTWAMAGAITRGFEENQAKAEAEFSSVEAVDWESTDRHVAVLSRDAAALLNVGKTTVTHSGGETWEATFTYSHVVVRRDGEWQTLIGHSSYEEG